MLIRVTGNERDVANSAWVSTLNEVRAQKKTHEDVLRVVGFLVEHHHTSPFESVTITMEAEEGDHDDSVMVYGMSPYSASEYGKKVTIDLLNFIKITHERDLWNYLAWQTFAEAKPVLAELVSGFGPIQDSSAEDVTSLLGDHGMRVELVHLHDEGSNEHSRATWRIKCPLSIAVQILRHRSGSYNMVSGRYKTIYQTMYSLPNDILEIQDKAEVDIYGEYTSAVAEIFPKYEKLMKQLKESKDAGKISNDEYKRARECVRFMLPEGRMTELYVTFYLSDFYNNYKKLRDSVHAQTEHIWIAQEMDRTINEVRK